MIAAAYFTYRFHTLVNFKATNLLLYTVLLRNVVGAGHAIEWNHCSVLSTVDSLLCLLKLGKCAKRTHVAIIAYVKAFSRRSLQS